MKRNYSRAFALVWVVIILFQMGCSRNTDPVPQAGGLTEPGVFILNQGNYTFGNSSLSYYYADHDSVISWVFEQVNGAPLGDIAQSMVIKGDTACIVVNNSGLIYMLDRHTGKYINKVTGLESPRHILWVDEQKAYVSDLYSKRLSVINNSGNLEKYIDLGRSSEQLIMTAGHVFVANWSSYQQSQENNMVMVIDPLQDMVIDSIEVGKEPNSMVVDGRGRLWVLCSGGFMHETNPSLWQIDPVSLSITKVFTFEDLQTDPVQLSYDSQSDRLYFLNGGVYSMYASDEILPSSPVVDAGGRTLFAASWVSGLGQLWVSDALDYQSMGVVYRYDSNGNLLGKFTGGIIPGAFQLNEE